MAITRALLRHTVRGKEAHRWRTAFPLTTTLGEVLSQAFNDFKVQ
jgi:hypothetical protein